MSRYDHLCHCGECCPHEAELDPLTQQILGYRYPRRAGLLREIYDQEDAEDLAQRTCISCGLSDHMARPALYRGLCAYCGELDDLRAGLAPRRSLATWWFPAAVFAVVIFMYLVLFGVIR